MHKKISGLNDALNTATNALKNSQNALQKSQAVNHLNAQTRQKMLDNLLFPNGVQNLTIRQLNVGDCYLLSSLYALSRNKKGQDIIRKMVTISDDGKILVKFHNQAPISVNTNCGAGQIINGVKKHTSFSNLGVKAIEAAYGKYRAGLSGAGNSKALQAINGGWADEAWKVLAGLKTTTHGVFKNGSFHSQKISIDKVLNTLTDDINNRVIMVATPPGSYGILKQVRNGKTIGWMDNTRKFICQHAYAVSNIDKVNKTVTVVNPWNTTVGHTMSYDEFSKIFGVIQEAVV